MERLRSDPDEIQDQAERLRLGNAGLSRLFVRTLGAGTADGYFQYNYCELFGRDITPGDGFGYSYLCVCLRGSLRLCFRGVMFELFEGDSMVFQGGEEYWVEPIEPGPVTYPTYVQLVCLGMLALPKRKDGQDRA